MSASHAADLELARRCAAGDPAAWDRFVCEFRPVLYRAADALDPHGSARELADSLYADLWGMKEADGGRQSLLRYFQGRSSLATWLRAVLAQRYVDRLRAGRRLAPLPDDSPDAPAAIPAPPAADPDPERPRYLALVREALGHAVARLPHKDRLRLAFYYVQELTLAEIGRLMREHESTVSRQLTRCRRLLRDGMEQELRQSAGLSDAQIAECVASVAGDPGPLDLAALLGGRSAEARERSL